MTWPHDNEDEKFTEPVFDPNEEIVLSPETENLMVERAPKCFLCKWILNDFRKHGKLTDNPFLLTGVSQFPVDAKAGHVALEKWIERMRRGKEV